MAMMGLARCSLVGLLFLGGILQRAASYAPVPDIQTEAFTFFPPSNQVGDRFGASLAIREPYIAVAAPSEVRRHGNATSVGAVYILECSKHDFGLEPFCSVRTSISPHEELAETDFFGASAHSVVFGSRGIVAVGAYGANDGRGAVYLFACAYLLHRVSCIPSGKLTPPAGDAGNSDVKFGFSLAMHGTLLVVGASGSVAGTAGQGQAFLFDCPSPWSCKQREQVLTNPAGGAKGDQFGFAVAINERLQVAVGAPGNAENKGAVHLFDCNPHHRMPCAAGVTLSDFPADSGMGGALAYVYNTLVVGTQSARSPIFVFKCDSAKTCSPSPGHLNDPGDAAVDGFGETVCIARAAHEYHYSTYVVVGAFNQQVGDNKSQGTAYRYDCRHTAECTSSPTIQYTQSDGKKDHEFGFPVACSPHLIAVTANSDSFAGAVYVFSSHQHHA